MDEGNKRTERLKETERRDGEKRKKVNYWLISYTEKRGLLPSLLLMNFLHLE